MDQMLAISEPEIGCTIQVKVILVKVNTELVPTNKIVMEQFALAL